MPAFTRGFFGACQGRAQHDRISAHADGFDDIPGVTHATVGDDVYVATTGFVHVVATGFGNIRNCGGHWHPDAQGTAGGRRCATPKSDEHTGGTGAHQVQCRGIAGHTPDNEGDNECVDELFQIKRCFGVVHVLV